MHQHQALAALVRLGLIVLLGISALSYAEPTTDRQYLLVAFAQPSGHTKYSRGDSFQRIALPAHVNIGDALAWYRQQPGVLHAEPDFALTTASVLPDDPLLAQQWSLYNIGQEIEERTGTAGADIGASHAWALSTGSREIVVAIIDTGMDYQHPDLVDNLWINPTPGSESDCEELSEDQPCYVDDLHGWNFAQRNDAHPWGTPDPMDDVGHGTHLAGIIGATGNNSLGISGINWQVRLMPLKFMDDRGRGRISDAIAAINYAVDRGAHIINASYLYEGETTSLFERRALDRAAEAGVLVVAPAGNTGDDIGERNRYPARHVINNLLAVTATDNRDQLAEYASYDAASIHMGAPGSSILSTGLDEGYDYRSGTSQSVALVSGAAALLWSLHPESSGQEIREHLLQTLHPLDDLTNTTLFGGRLDLAAAMSTDRLQLPPVPPTHLQLTESEQHHPQLQWLVNSTQPGSQSLSRCHSHLLEGVVCNDSDFVTIATLDAEENQHEDTEVHLATASEGSQWSYRLRTHGPNQVSNWSEVARVSILLRAPQALSLTLDGVEVILDWENHSEAAQKIIIERRDDNGEYDVMAELPPDQQHWQQAVTESGTYRYRICAFHEAFGCSNYLLSDLLVINPHETGKQSRRSSDLDSCMVLAAYNGQKTDAELASLRQFRDGHLRYWPGGSWMIERYYAYSPTVSQWMSEKPWRSQMHRQFFSLAIQLTDAVIGNDH